MPVTLETYLEKAASGDKTLDALCWPSLDRVESLYIEWFETCRERGVQVDGCDLRDVGEGLGLFQEWLKKEWITMKVTGVEAAKEFHEHCVENYPEHTHVHGVFPHHALGSLYDHVVMFGTLTWMSEEMANEVVVAGALRAKRSLAFNLMDPALYSGAFEAFHPARLLESLKVLGFDVIILHKPKEQENLYVAVRK